MDTVRRVIIALDTGSLEQACDWVDRFHGRVNLFKVGSQLFTSAGPRAVEAVKERGGEVFLDLKYHDIPNTVGRAMRAAAALGVTMVDVHAMGGPAMISAAVEAAGEEAARGGRSSPRVLAVTILTSLDGGDLARLGLGGDVETCVMRLAEMAIEAGAHGLVASPREVRALRSALGRETVLVTPGIRSVEASREDQKRVMAPRDALKAGADYLVMGRSLLEAQDPMQVLQEISG